MHIVALQTARAGSKGVPNKNTIKIKNQPLFLHNLIYAKRSQKIKQVYVTTDDEMIVNVAKANGVIPINRPYYLRNSHSSHWGTIIHGLLKIEEYESKKVDILVVLFGNTYGAYTHHLDSAIDMLISDPKLDSVMSVSLANFHNPFRAWKIVNNRMTTILPQEFIVNNAICVVSDRNAAGDTYFFNGSFWIVKREPLIRCDGLEPFPWIGSQVAPFIQNPVLQELDMNWQKELLEHAEIEYDG